LPKLNSLSPKRGPLLRHLDGIEAQCVQGDVTLKTIFSILGDEGHYVLIFFLILPFLQPIPLVGLSTPFGLLIAVVGYFAYVKRPALIPKRWEQHRLPHSTVLKIAEGSEYIFEKLSFLFHPRWKLFFGGPFRIANTILLILNAILLALPLPIPFSNAIPAWGILFQALGHLEEDGVLIALSYIQALFCLAFFASIVFGLGSSLEFLVQF
jgi:hypothetical protein